MIDLKAVAIGIKAGVLSSLCCVGPLILVVLGIGTVSAALSLTQYRPYFILLGLVFMAAATWYHLKKNCSDGTCLMNKKQFIATALAVYAVILVVLLYAVVPAIAPMVFSSQQPVTASLTPDAKQVSLGIDGLTCPGCSGLVENSLLKKQGILRAEVSYEEASAVVWYDPGMINEDEIVKAVPEPYKAYIINEQTER